MSSNTAKRDEGTGAGKLGSSSQKTAKGAGLELEMGDFSLSSKIANDDISLLSSGA